MITFFQLGKHGRLGNQLYQYAALRGISEKTGLKCKIPDFENFLWHGQKCLLSNFNIKADYCNEQDIRSIERNIIEPDPNVFYEEFFTIPSNSNIHGFFQFTKYFDHCEELIRQELKPKEPFLLEAKKKLDLYRQDGHEIVSIHIRRGDMMTVMHPATGIHPDQVYGPDNIFDDNTIYGNYLNKAMSLFQDKKVKYLVFSGGNRSGDDSSDIQYIRKVFSDNRFIISDSNDPMQDFSLIMSCDHNISCHQTSFGWWASYMNSSEGRIVTAPQHYYFEIPKEKSDARVSNGTFPSSWTIIE
jgi:hypothetical protein|tara:strand:- start:11047 stop:11946 length:900 start_codon:yes stop_codon:yes gene_type:complete